jgi:hypothetical protein
VGVKTLVNPTLALLRHSRSQDLGGQPKPAYGEQSESSKSVTILVSPIWLALEVFHLAHAYVEYSIVMGRDY